MTAPRACQTCNSLMAMVASACAKPWTRAEIDDHVRRAKADIERLAPILAARERDRLLRMPTATEKIQ